MSVPTANMEEIIPAARLLSRATALTPSDYERAKSAFLSGMDASRPGCAGDRIHTANPPPAIVVPPLWQPIEASCIVACSDIVRCSTACTMSAMRSGHSYSCPAAAMTFLNHWTKLSSPWAPCKVHPRHTVGGVMRYEQGS